MSSDNLKLWSAVEKTDPKYTKAFSKAGGFSGTAINATYLIRKATELWGPMGGLWGPEIADEKYVEGAEGTIIHVLRINLKHPQGILPSYGQTTFVGKNKHGMFTDEEAPKKSLTDAITKALSMLGFSADVFMGAFDDNKYVNSQEAKPAYQSVSRDVWDTLDIQVQTRLQGIADHARSFLDGGKAKEAVELIKKEALDADLHVALWSRFNSSERSAMKKAA